LSHYDDKVGDFSFASRKNSVFAVESLFLNPRFPDTPLFPRGWQSTVLHLRSPLKRTEKRNKSQGNVFFKYERFLSPYPKGHNNKHPRSKLKSTPRSLRSTTVYIFPINWNASMKGKKNQRLKN